MCLVALAIDQSRKFPLVVASSRDEFFARRTAPLAWWTPQPGMTPILSGRHLESGGTWLGLSAHGRLGIVTNLRGAIPFDDAAPSRGRIVADWLCTRQATDQFWMRTALLGYNGFNLIAADFQKSEFFWASNTGVHPRRLSRGVYGLSNGALDAPGPEVAVLKARLSASMDTAPSVDELATRLFTALGDCSVAAQESVPHTDDVLPWDPQPAAAFVRTGFQTCGTRCSTLIITERVRRQPITHVFERSFDETGALTSSHRTSLRNWPPGESSGGSPQANEAGLAMEPELAPDT